MTTINISSSVTIDLRRDVSVSQLMQENISNTPLDKIIYEDSLTGKTATYGGFRQQVQQVAAGLRFKLGLKQGEIVSVLGPSCVDYLLTMHAVWWVGGIVSTINHSSTSADVKYVMELVKPHYMVVHSSYIGLVQEAIRHIKPGVAAPELISLVGRSDQLPLLPDDVMADVTGKDAECFQLTGQDAHQVCAAIAMSSGTSGPPKAVMLSHYNLVSSAQQLRAHNTDNWNGQMREIFFPLMSTRKATLARMVPTIARLLGESQLVQKYQFPFLEYFSCSAAPLLESTAEKLRAAFPGVSICQTYGCTEATGAVTQTGVRDSDCPPVSVGSVIANASLRLVNVDTGEDVGPGKAGEVWIGGPSVMMGYKDNPKATASSVVDEGWYKTGDVGIVDQKGYLVIVDRIKDVIKYKGFQVSPSELEDVISRHPAVDEVCVTAAWDESQSTEVPRAFVVLKSSARSSAQAQLEIQDFVTARVSGYKALRGGVKFIDSLPKSPAGKVLRRQLPREMIRPSAPSGIAKL